MEHRRRGRARPPAVRALVALAGVGLLVASVPALVVLPEAGVPLLLLALRLLAVEFDWAAGAYAWVVWRSAQLKAWFGSRPRPVRALIVLALVALAVLLVWLLLHALH
jgi:hypothetical protein